MFPTLAAENVRRGPETRIPTSLGGGAAWSENDQNIAENGWLLPFFAGEDAGKWVKESWGHLPWSVLSLLFAKVIANSIFLYWYLSLEIPTWLS